MEVGNLTHSHSQPGEMDRTPPGTPKKGGKMLAVKVLMLDDTVTMFQIQAKALGRVLFDQVCNQLNLLESDYFGLEYQEAGGTKYWLDLEKPLCRQIGLSLVDILVKFCVKFYTPDPSQLEEEFTRYLFCLQIKRDLSQGLLQCNSNTAALMASYIVQAECGDYVVEDYPDHRYLSSYKFVPNQDQELERRIMENHKKHAGQSPAEADLNLLETARRCELYGIKMHPAKDHEGCPLNLAVAHMGIVVFQNFSKINTFSWAKIRKISFKRKRFLVKLHPEGYGYYKDTVEFFFEGRNECKNFWKKCVENHGFFRCTMVKKVPRQKTRVLSRGSSFRYSGRTQKQIVDFVRENYVKRQTFQRSQSFRHSSSAHSSVANVGTSISAHPLLPLGDNAVAGTPASLSCGSMTLTSSPVHTADIHAGGSPSPPLTTSVSPGTSVTSSPQHIYPQETPYRRTGHRLTKVKHSPMRSHRAISPLSPTDAATPAANRSANRSNNVTPDASDIASSINSFKSPDFVHSNHVYSNCYTSFRSLANDPQNDRTALDSTKIDIFSLPSHLFNGTHNTNDSVSSPNETSKTLLPACEHDLNRYTWHRSASCKDLYHNADIKNQKSSVVTSEPSCETISLATRRDRSRRKCYSVVTSKNPSVERTGNGSGDMRVYSSSYPGTTSSFSTEPAEGELEDRIVEALGVRYDSQEDIGLSHDDVSHDSYELLERELDQQNEDSLRNRRDLMLIGESERVRSCSWGSDRGVNLLNFHSAESGIGSGLDVSRKQNFWSLEREKSSKHKSESDFRTLSKKGSRDCDSLAKKSEGSGRYYDDVEGLGKTEEFLDYDNRLGKRSREIKEEVHKTMSWKQQLENRTVSGKESYRSIGEDLGMQKSPREFEESYKSFERQKYEMRRKSIEGSVSCADFYLNPLELGKETPIRKEELKRMEKRREKKEREERFHEGLKEKEEKEWEKRQTGRRKTLEEKELRGEEMSRKIMQKSGGYGNFQEIQFKKFDRVVSNQFGRYSEFLSQENSFFAQEKEIEPYDKGCQESVVKEQINSLSGNGLVEKNIENIEKVKLIGISSYGESMEFKEWRNGLMEPSGLAGTPGEAPRAGRTVIERTKSDPYNSVKCQKRNVLIHQKSVDLTPQQSEEIISDYDNEDGFKKGSRSEHDIPYILHKRHCMNGTARNGDLKTPVSYRNANPLEGESKIGKVGIEAKKSNLDLITSLKQRPSSAKVAEAKKAGVQIINLDAKNGKAIVNIAEPKRVSNKYLKAPALKKTSTDDSKTTVPKALAKKESKRTEVLTKAKKDNVNIQKNARGREEAFTKDEQNEEPIYSEVCREKIVPDEGSLPPQPPKRSSSFLQKPDLVEQKKSLGSDEGEPLGSRMRTSEQKSVWEQPEGEKEKQIAERKVADERGRSEVTWGWGRGRGKGTEVHGRREESLTLFARTRLGVSEGSAFAAIVKEGVRGSPGCQRRAKSLDAPYVSVHSLPPADAFSSKDDTVEGSEEDIVNSAVTRFKDFRRGEGKRNGNDKNGEKELGLDITGTESEVDSVFTDDLEIGSTFRNSVMNQSKVDVSFGDEKILGAVRGKRLLSKIESVDFIDSEGDMDSSKMAEPPPIPSDRLVNLPECIRFPSVRQISGQTSEESGDGWDQDKVKVKRRTPRRSVGREEQDPCGESVVWDSKDEEPPEETWDEKVGTVRKYEGLVVNAVGLGTEYLKRGSCGQSIDDDNLSTPMKESSPEHWVSVDDLPEALEREEKLLKQQEKILREKILNEKLKRELNLDTVDIDERYCDFKDSIKQSKYEEETLSLKESLKGHSLDTYELNEKKTREKKANKFCTSLDEELLPNKLIHTHVSLDMKEKTSAKVPSYAENLDYIQCRVVKDVAEIEQFGDNDEELEEFFVVLDEGLEREERNMIWEDEDSLRRALSNDDSLISVPEEFKDVEGGAEERSFRGKVEIRLSEVGGKKEDERDSEYIVSQKESSCLKGLAAVEKILWSEEGGNLKEWGGDLGGLSPLDGSRRGSEEKGKPSLSEETGRLSPYDSCSRRGSDEPRRLSTSEDSRKCSVSESISEETRRRLSSTEETRRKRASLTKQCSVGVDSLSDEVISGIQECSSSFEHDDKDVFETEPVNLKLDDEQVGSLDSGMNLGVEKGKELPLETPETLRVKHFEEKKVVEALHVIQKGLEESNGTMHLVPPSSERDLSRETEDSVDYGEGDLKDITDIVKEKDLSEGAIPDKHSLKAHSGKSQSFLEKRDFSKNDDFLYIDDKRANTPEVIIGQSKEDITTSIVVVNEGISVLKKINEKGKELVGDVEMQPLPEIPTPGAAHQQQRHTLPKTFSKSKPLAPKPLEYTHSKLTKNYIAETKIRSPTLVGKESVKMAKNISDSSQESDLDRLSDISLVSHVQNVISRRNLSEAGRCLRRDDIATIASGDSCSWKTSEEKEKTDQSSSDDLMIKEEQKPRERKLDAAVRLKSGFEGNKGKREGGKNGQEKRDSGEDGSSSSSAPLCPKKELSSTWKPFLLESSGSSSLEEGWLPPDENAHLADEEETSSTSNNQQDDSCHDDIDYPTGIGYPVLNVSSAEMMIGAFGSVYTLSRTLSRISERSISEQERSDLEDDISKPSSRSISVEEESILSSDHQPSLSSDPSSPKETASIIPDLPVDRPTSHCLEPSESSQPFCEPFDDIIPPPVPDEDWPSPPSSPSVMDTPVVSHVETFYMEIHPEKACKVVVAESREEENSSSDDNQTLHEESEFLVLSSDNISASTTTTTTLDGTVVIPIRPKNGKRGSVSEEASMISSSERSGTICANEETYERKGSLSGENEGEISRRSSSSKYSLEQDSQKSKASVRVKPLKLSSPTGKTYGFFETPVSKVRSPTSQMKFFETADRGASGYSALRSPTSFSETMSPKCYGRFFDGSTTQSLMKGEASERRTPKSPTAAKGGFQRSVCTPYYSNVADSAEKSYFGRYDTGSLERTKIQSSRKCTSYYSVSRTTANDGNGPSIDVPPAASPNTIPRASKRTKRRHRVAMDLIVRNGRIVAPPQTNTTVLENSDSDRSLSH